MNVRRRNNNFYYCEGQYRKSLALLWREITGEPVPLVKTKTEAQLYAAKIYQIRHGDQFSPTLGVDVAMAIDKYLEHCRKHDLAEKTLTQKRQQLELLAGRFVHNLNTVTVQGLLDRLTISGASKNRYIATYNRFNRFCIKQGYARHRLELERYQEHKEVVGRVITATMLDRLCEVAGEPFKWVILLGYYTGLRRREVHYVLSLKRGIEGDNPTVLIPASKSKNRAVKVIPLNKQAVECIERLSRLDVQFHADYITHRFIKVAEICGYKLRFHDLCHTFISRCRLIASASQTARLVGHKDPRTTELIYTHYDTEVLRKIVDSM